MTFESVFGSDTTLTGDSTEAYDDNISTETSYQENKIQNVVYDVNKDENFTGNNDVDGSSFNSDTSEQYVSNGTDDIESNNNGAILTATDTNVNDALNIGSATTDQMGIKIGVDREPTENATASGAQGSNFTNMGSMAFSFTGFASWVIAKGNPVDVDKYLEANAGSTPSI